MNIQDELTKLKQLLRGADEVNIKIRKDAQDVYFEADWLLKVLERVDEY